MSAATKRKLSKVSLRYSKHRERTTRSKFAFGPPTPDFNSCPPEGVYLWSQLMSGPIVCREPGLLGQAGRSQLALPGTACWAGAQAAVQVESCNPPADSFVEGENKATGKSLLGFLSH